MSLPTFRNGVHCAKALRPLMCAVRCVVRFSTLLAHKVWHIGGRACKNAYLCCTSVQGVLCSCLTPHAIGTIVFDVEEGVL